MKPFDQTVQELLVGAAALVGDPALTHGAERIEAGGAPCSEEYDEDH